MSGQKTVRMTYAAIAGAWGAMQHIAGPGRITDPERSQRLYRLMMEVGRHAEDAERVRRQLLAAAQADPAKGRIVQQQLARLEEMEAEMYVTPLPANFFTGAAVEPGALYALGPLYEGWTRESPELPKHLRALLNGVLD